MCAILKRYAFYLLDYMGIGLFYPRGVVAFLINYMEMSRHYAEKRKPLIQAFQHRGAHFLFVYVHNAGAGLWPPFLVLIIHT